MWTAVSQIWDKESDRYWTRSNVFLLINGALIAFASADRATPLVTAAVSLFGIILCSLWLRVKIVGKYYLDRWRAIMKPLEKDWPLGPTNMCDEMDATDEISTTYEPSSTYMKWVIQVIAVLWLVLFGISAFQIVK